MTKIAVMLPLGLHGSSLRDAKNIAKSIALMARQRADDLQVVFSYEKSGNYELYSDFNDLREYGVSLRETVWEIFSLEALRATIRFAGLDTARLDNGDYCLPTDGANDFFDCDLWLVISDRLPAPLFPLRKYACVVYDYVQRYVPEVWGDGPKWALQEQALFPLLQHAARVFVTTPSTRADMIAYAGLPGSQIVLLEMGFEPPALNPRHDKFELNLPSKYFVWATNPAFHNNHIHALDALQIYYQEFAGKFSLVVTGPGSEFLNPQKDFGPTDPVMALPHIRLARQKIRASLALQDRLRFIGNVPEKILSQVLRDARFLWHPARYDNGNSNVIEAAFFHHPALSSRYPAMEYIDETFKLNLSFANPHDPREMAGALFSLEKNYRNIELPHRKSLLARSWQANAPALYRSIRELV